METDSRTRTEHKRYYTDLAGTLAIAGETARAADIAREAATLASSIADPDRQAQVLAAP